MQETLKANPYVYAANDAVNATDPSGKSSWGSAFLSCLGSVPIIAMGVVGSIPSVLGGIAAYLPQLMALFIDAATPAAATLATIDGIGAGVAILGLIVVGGILLACGIAATQNS